MATNVPELKAECARHSLTLEQLASKIGISSTSLYRKMSGKTEFYRNELQTIRDVLYLDDEQFLHIFFDNQLAKTQEIA